MDSQKWKPQMDKQEHVDTYNGFLLIGVACLVVSCVVLALLAFFLT